MLVKKTHELRKQPSIHSKDTIFMQEEQIPDEHTSHIQTEKIQGSEKATVKHEEVIIPIKKSLDMQQSHPTEDDVSY